MTQQRLKRLNQLLLIKEKVTRDAAAAWAKARDQFIVSKNQHDLLLGYRHDYVQQLQTMGDAGCTVGRLRNRIEFIAQLDSGMLQLNQQLAQLAKIRTQCEKKFLQEKAAEEAVVRLIARVKMQTEHQNARIEQKEIDEYAQKQWYSKKSAPNTE